jgi:threonine/homoserine/homoserine lactone efflux protein|tara:strand:- start:114 stop:740 length:627 start_codon:yes stop_codon:yes gene_type:complete
MSLLINFLVGFIAAFVGVAPPGLLNMSAVKISIKEGRKAALLFSIGVFATVLIQTYTALQFAKYLDQHPEVVNMLQKVALGIFICITIYFFFIAKDTRREIPENVKHSKTNRFFYGMLLGVLNLLPLPYWVYMSITFSGFGMFSFSLPSLIAAVLASGLGTFAMLMLYIQFFKQKKDSVRIKVNMNYVIGLITGVISIVTLLKILKEL